MLFLYLNVLYIDYQRVDADFLAGTRTFSLLARYHGCSHQVHVYDPFYKILVIKQDSWKH